MKNRAITFAIDRMTEPSRANSSQVEPSQWDWLWVSLPNLNAIISMDNCFLCIINLQLNGQRQRAEPIEFSRPQKEKAKRRMEDKEEMCHNKWNALIEMRKSYAPEIRIILICWNEYHS